MQKQRIKRIWYGMLKRCFDEGNTTYHRYGGRGIKVCDEWLEYANFEDWSLKNGYSDELSIDRIDNDGDYAPHNCRWATKLQQANNTSTNHFITFHGVTKTCAEWDREMSFRPGTVKRRLMRGWDETRAITEKLGTDNYRQKITYKDETRTVGEWARIVGLPYPLLWRRIFKFNYSIEDALETPHQCNPIYYEFEGKNLSVHEWAKITGIAADTIVSRVKYRGWDIERALTTPVRITKANRALYQSTIAE